MLTRLADESYDLVFVDANPVDQPQFVAEGVRLLRPGGAIVVHRAALGGRAGDANANDAEVSAVREAARLIAEDERLTPVLDPTWRWPAGRRPRLTFPASSAHPLPKGVGPEIARVASDNLPSQWDRHPVVARYAGNIRTAS